LHTELKIAIFVDILSIFLTAPICFYNGTNPFRTNCTFCAELHAEKPC